MVSNENTSEMRGARAEARQLDRAAAVIVAIVAGPTGLLLVGHFHRASSFSSGIVMLLAGIVFLGVLALCCRSGAPKRTPPIHQATFQLDGSSSLSSWNQRP